MSSSVVSSSRLASAAVRELRLHLCQRSASSQGAREWVQKFYPALKQSQPQLPVLVRECSGIEPRLWVRFAFGQEQSFPINNASAEQIKQIVDQQVNEAN